MAAVKDRNVSIFSCVMKKHSYIMLYELDARLLYLRSMTE